MKSKVDSLVGIEETVGSIERSMQEMSKKYDDVFSETKVQSHNVSGLKEAGGKRRGYA